MKLTITTLNELVYRFADKTIADDEFGVYRGRIENNIALSRSVSDSGSSLTSITIHLINHDKIIPDSVKLWNAKAEILTDNGHSWAGKVTSYRTDAGGKLILVATEQTAPELSRDLPDEFVRLVEIDENVHVSALNLTLPIVVGGTTTNPIPVKGILKNKTNGIYYLCVGEIHEIVNVRVGTEKLTRAEAEAKGYICYTGAADQENEPGIAYIQITDPNLRKNSDGSYVEIGAEVLGLKLGTHTSEECRNGARFLLWLLKTAATGPCGWGLGIDEADIDLDSFATAIAAVDAAGLKLDGLIYEQKTARNWITEICRAIRGIYEIGSDGKRRLFVQAPSSSEFTFTDSDIELVSDGMGAFTGRVYNKGRLNYSYNSFTGIFMQFANYADSVSIGDIEEQEFVGCSYLIRDALTAQKILDFTCKSSLISAYSIIFQLIVLPRNLQVGKIITVNHSKRQISGLFKITSLHIGDNINRIEAVRYDPSVFESGSTSSEVMWVDDQPVAPTYAPGTPANLNLSNVLKEQNDKTAVIMLAGTFDLPDGYVAGFSVEYAENEPFAWKSHGVIVGNAFEIGPVAPSRLYYVRVRAFTTTAHSDFIVASLRTLGDLIAPGVPRIAASCFLQIAKLQIYLNNPPKDLVGFRVYRSLDTVENAEYVGHTLADSGLASYVDKLDVYGNVFYYFAKAYDFWGNESEFSSSSEAVKAHQVADSDLLKALTPADSLNTDPFFTDPSAWARIDNEPINEGCFSSIDDGVVGNNAFICTSSNTYQIVVSEEKLIPYDSSRKFVVEGYLNASTGIHRMGFAFYDKDKNYLTSQLSDVVVDSLFHKKTILLTNAPDFAVYLSPTVQINADETIDAELKIQKLQLREIITADRLVANEAVITSSAQVANAIIGNAHIQNLDAGKITSGEMKSNNYVPPSIGKKFATSGSSYDLDNAAITTENFYSSADGAGFKGDVQADSGRVGVFYIKDKFLSNFPILKIESARVGAYQEFLYYFSIIYRDILDGVGRPIDYFFPDGVTSDNFEEYAEQELLCFEQMAEILGNNAEFAPLSEDIAFGCKVVVQNTLPSQSNGIDIIAKILYKDDNIYCKVFASDYLNPNALFWRVVILYGAWEFNNFAERFTYDMEVPGSYITGPFVSSESYQAGSTPYLAIEISDHSMFTKPNPVYPAMLFKNWNGLDIAPPPWSPASIMFGTSSDELIMSGGNLRANFDENTGNSSLTMLGELKTESSVLYPNKGSMFLDSAYVGTIWILLGHVDLEKSDRYSINTKILIDTMRLEFNITGNAGTPGQLSFMSVSSDNWSPIWNHLTYDAWLMSANGAVYLRLGRDNTNWYSKTLISVIDSYFPAHIRGYGQLDMSPGDLNIGTVFPAFSSVVTTTHPFGNAVNIIPGIIVTWTRIAGFWRNPTRPGTWCRRYSNGYLEQGGIIRKEDYPDPGNVTISFWFSGGGTNSNYYDTDYSLTLTAHADGTLYPLNSSANIIQKTTSGFTCGRFFVSPTQHGETDCSVTWTAAGFTTAPE